MYEVRESLNAKAGLGLFATADIKIYTKIAEIKGECVTNEDYQKLPKKTQAYCVQLNSTKVLVGLCGDGRFANCCYRDPLKRTNNAWLSKWKGQIFVKSKRKIRKGEEILASYGNSYTRYLLKD